MTSPVDPSPPPRRIRSFVRRAGRTTRGQARALTDLGPGYVLPYATGPLDPIRTWGRAAPWVMEIGFGMGEATAQVAREHPDWNLLGCEVHEPGIGALLKRLGADGSTNVRIVAHDAVEVLAHMVPRGSLQRLHLWFPDPWHKKRHHKRRLVQLPFTTALAEALAPGGLVHMATDWVPYAEQMLAVLAATPGLRNTSTEGGFVPRPPWRPPSKFEQRGLRLGHEVRDLVFERLPVVP